MKKLFVKICIWLFIVFTGATGKLNASESAVYTKTFTQTNFSADNENYNLPVFESSFKTAFKPSEKSIDKIDPTDTEDEEDETGSYKSLSFKKLAGISGYYIPAHNILVPQYSFSTLIKNQSLHYCKLLVYIPAGKRYVLFRVFRI